MAPGRARGYLRSMTRDEIEEVIDTAVDLVGQAAAADATQAESIVLAAQAQTVLLTAILRELSGLRDDIAVELANQGAIRA